MLALLQRTSNASVSVHQRQVATIDKGLVVMVAVQKEDDESAAEKLSRRILKLRLFSNETEPTPTESAAQSPTSSGKMDLNVIDVKGALLMVPQFTLGADLRKGNRPSFHLVAAPDRAQFLFDHLCDILARSLPVERGVFGADMQVSLVNEGPVTFLLSS